MSKTCKKLLASALAATMLFSTFVSSLVVSAAATGTLKIGTETITVGTESATVDFTLTFSEAVTAPQDLATIVAKNANEETLAIIGAELGEVTYVVDGEETKSPIIDGVVPDEDVEPPTVSVSGTNLDAGKILFESGVAGALDVKVINFTVTFDTTTATVGTYTVTATTDGTDYDEADVVVTTEDGAIVVEEPHTCTAGEATDNGNGTHDIACAGNCGKLFADNEACNYVEGICDVCGAEDPNYEPPVTGPVLDANMKIAGTTVTFLSDLVINYYVYNTAIPGYTDITLECELASGDTRTIAIEPSNATMQVFKFTGISAKELGDTMTVTIHGYKDGVEYYGTPYEYSIATYCYYQIRNSSNSKFVTACVDLLNYAAEAQKYTKYKVDTLVNADLTAEEAAKGTQGDVILENKQSTTGTASSVFDVAGTTLSYKSKVEINIYLSVVDMSIFDDLSIKISYTDSKGEHAPVIDSSNFKKSGNFYIVNFSELAAKDLSSVLTITCYNGDEQIGRRMTYSPEYYAAYMQGKSDAAVTMAMMRYSDSLKKYLG